MLYPSLSFRDSQYLLDRYPAVAAYSFRQLKTGVTSVVRVRRGSDNSEQDFTAAEITDGALAAFCGASNGFVTTWYDQSGNGYNATQPIAANQPKIYDSATSLITENGKPALSFDGTNDTLENSTLFTPGAVSLFVVAERQSLGSLVVVPRATPNTLSVHELIYTSALEGAYIDVSFPTGTIPNSGGIPLSTANGNQVLLSFVYDGAGTALADYAINEDGVSKTIVSSGALGYASERFSLGSRSVQKAYYLAGTMQEIIVYSSDQSASRADIEGNINSHYGIY